MIMERNYDSTSTLEYETWSELPGYQVYDADISIIIDGALDWMAFESLWCFRIKSDRGKSEEEILNALNNNGTLYFENAREYKWYELTKEKLIVGLAKVINSHEIITKKPWLCTAGYSAELCDIIVQVSLFGEPRY